MASWPTKKLPFLLSIFYFLCCHRNIWWVEKINALNPRAAGTPGAMDFVMKQIADLRQPVIHTLQVILSCTSTAPGVPMERLPGVGLVSYPPDVPTAHIKKYLFATLFDPSQATFSTS